MNNKFILTNEDVLTDIDNQTNETRIIRKEIVVNSKSTPILIYEPSEMDYNEIRNLMDKNKSHQFNMKEIFDVLIYRFSNLDMTALDEQTRCHLLQNPPMYLKRVIAEIRAIIAEIQETYFAETMSKMSEIEMTFKMTEAIHKVQNIDMAKFKENLSKLKPEDIKKDLGENEIEALKALSRTLNIE